MKVSSESIIKLQTSFLFLYVSALSNSLLRYTILIENKHLRSRFFITVRNQFTFLLCNSRIYILLFLVYVSNWRIFLKLPIQDNNKCVLLNIREITMSLHYYWYKGNDVIYFIELLLQENCFLSFLLSFIFMFITIVIFISKAVF